MLKRNRYTKKLCFEGLENRTLMAGDVTAAVVDGVLQIAGDAADNSIQIKQSGKVWQVQGIDTTVNGNNSAQTFTGVTIIEIGLGAGDDSINAIKGKLSGRFEIIDTDGSQTTIGLTKIQARTINLYLNDGADTITIDKCSVTRRISVNSSDNADRADRVTISNTKAVESIGVATGSGDDVVAIESVKADDVYIDAGDGADRVTMTNAKVGDEVGVSGGETSADEGDTIVLTKIKSSRTSIHSGAGADAVTLTKVAVQDYQQVNLGEGNSDQLIVSRSSGADANFNGGDQDDDTIAYSRNKFKTKMLIGFEAEA